MERRRDLLFSFARRSAAGQHRLVVRGSDHPVRGDPRLVFVLPERFRLLHRRKTSACSAGWLLWRLDNSGCGGTVQRRTREPGLVADPFVLTLRLDRASFHRLEAERRAYFPAELNRVPAHVSLFHQLPGEEREEIDAVLHAKSLCCGVINVRAAGLRSLGRGVAYRLESAPLLSLRSELASAFEPWLTRQDQQRFQPHVTIQNKVRPDEAKYTMGKLQAAFAPFNMQGVGLCLWRYLAGFWSLEKSYRFNGR